ncbi:hypothetical protein [Tengunoibacter tsumagoiensis]|uniref:Uncharacterized protein n=1 Tax=Tengunoibacter tsumagoiensis TaxID=2014871 RepID=A0A402A4A6_9CHLR|nr:hypothetical protein [Tengunoibacter tsumagoiensis]GCE13841.1 hypothetical protein KTT_37000 [Tengunoibacter tsumagoiensis]
MHFNLIQWLFTDPITASNNANLPNEEPFRLLWPYLVFCCAGLLITFYYFVEGRKRFVKSKPIIKYMFDRYLTWFGVICFIGLPIIFARVYLDGFFFAWRLWRYLWAVALIGWAVTWIVYLVKKYPAERDNFVAYQNRQQYIRTGKRKVKTAR